MRILVTGGAGYIGTHTLIVLLRERHDVLVVDNFSSGSPEALDRVRQLANADFEVFEADLRDSVRLNESFAVFRPEAVIHFAGLKAVAESVEKPLDYYSQNVAGSIELLKAMERHNCLRIVFSSSASVYGIAEYLPFDEDHRIKPMSPYGRSKYFTEELIRDWVASKSDASAVLLRYFNPVGAHASGMIGEDPSSVPSNLLPHIAQVAAGELAELTVFGGDYDTRDGTGERDFIHVEDLARAHLAAVESATNGRCCEAINVGTGQGVTVLEMIECFARASGRKIPYRITSRRSGDVARSIAGVTKAKRLLNWRAELGIDEMCESAWRWQSRSPFGYTTEQVRATDER
ncbi:UDP-glucose 4-epimerase GalE [Aquibium carbonis]|uniref:UDP-glucose 4-epimerase n=1 Tax=Aquibium carbonis TaxID=2495581 RepID=A0A3R9YDK9_9HYPH|nr:UDP-glucose 4-epimerase GalE [Aquibium carbonis]RST85176.1 UDP-glucose 4-epimerase GalE [Aquibium carbonis]